MLRHRLLRRRVTAPGRVALTTLWAAVALCVMLAAAPAGAVVWSADMTVVDYGTGAIGAGSAGLLTNQGGSAGLQATSFWYYAPQRKLSLRFTTGVDDADDLVLQAGGLLLTFPEGSSGNSSFSWSGVDAAWTDGETVAVQLAQAGTDEAPADGLDDVTFAVSATPSAVPEGETATVTVAISNGVPFAEDQTITLAVSGTASSDDYEVKPQSLRLTLSAGETSVALELEALEDDEEEAAETVILTASHGGVVTGSVTLTIRSISHDATLSALSLSGIDVGTFSGAETSYTVYVEEAIETTTVTATASHPAAAVSIEPGAEVSLAAGDNDILVTVTAEDGVTTKTYTVTVVRHVRPLTAFFLTPPAFHVGSGTFSLRIVFSEPIATGFQTLKVQCFQEIQCFQVKNGEVRSARRMSNRDDLWNLEVTPASAADVAVSLPPTTDCAAARALCTESGKPLSKRLTVLIPGPANTRATGLPSISGTARVGEALTASADGIADADGLENATYAWQWLAGDGTDDTEIEDASGESYTLTATEAGKTVKVRVTFTDDKGNEETLVSETTETVAATAPSAPVGLAVTTGEGREQELTLSWTVPESDGGSEVTSYRVQWKSGAEAWDGSETSTRQALLSDPAATGHTIAGLVNGTAYAVRVLALNGAGDGAAAAAEATVQDRVAPALTGAAVDRVALTLTFSEALDADSKPSADVFAVTVASDARTVTEVSLSGSAVELTLASAVVSGEVVTVGYTAPAGANATPLRDAAGNVVAGFTSTAVTNETAALPRVSIAAGTGPVTEGAEAAFMLTRTGSVSAALTVTVEVTESGAVLDGAAQSGIGFAPGEARVAIVVATVDDEAVEDTSTVTVTVAAGDGWTVDADAGSAAVTVEDDDAAPEVVTASALSAAENATAVAVLEAADADTASADLVWSIAGGVDSSAFTLTSGGELAFGAAKDFEAPDDADGDGTYAVTVRVTDGANPVDAALTVSLTDVDEIAPVLEPISLSVADTHVQEGPGATLDFVLRLSRAAVKPITVHYRAYDGTATAGADYTAVNASVVFSPGDVEKTVSVAVLEDAHEEGAETVKFWLWGMYGLSTEQVTDPHAVGTILSDKSFTVAAETTAVDPATPLTASFEGVPAEHDGSTVFTFRLRFSEAPAVSYKVLRDHAFTVSGGLVRKAKRVDGRNDLREIHIKPSGPGAVAISLPATTDCNAAKAICTADSRPLSNAPSATVQGPPVLSVADAQVTEAAGASIDFVVSLSRAATGTVTVDYATADGSATAGADYTAASGTLIFSSSQTSKTVSVTVLDDTHDDDGETFTLRLSNAAGARIADSEATGTIVNTDPLPKGWLARFGRASAVQVVGLLDARFDEASAPASQLTLGGRSVTVSAPGGHRRDSTDPAGGPVGPDTDPVSAPAPDLLHANPTIPAAAPSGWNASSSPTRASGLTGAAGGVPNETAGSGAVPPGTGTGEATLLERAVWGLLTESAWQVDKRQFISRSSFDLSLSSLGKDPDESIETVAATPDVPGHWSLWGRGALVHFGGIDAGVRLDGDVLTGLLGLDYARERWLAGVALAYNDGDGTYRSPGSAGELDSTLVSVNPYLRYALTERLSVWGALGYGRGTLTLRPARVTAAGDGLKSVPGDSGDSGDSGVSGESESIETAMQMGMGALGLRGVLYASASTELALKSDALWVHTSSADAPGLRAVDNAETSRIRLLLSGRHQRALANDALLTPSFELGLRFDDGAAETGLGVELGGGLRYADPVRGLTLETLVRALLAHEDGGYEEWGVGGSLALDPGRLGRGLALRLDSGWGMTDSGAEALWQRQTTAGLARGHNTTAQGRIKAEWGYGLDVPWTHGLLTPYGSVELAGGGSRTLRLGWRFELGQRLSLSLAGERRETAHARPEHGLMLRTTLPW